MQNRTFIARARSILNVRYLYFFSIPIIFMSIVFVILFHFFGEKSLVFDNLTSVVYTLLQIVTFILGINVIGITISLSSYDKGINIRSIFSEVDNCFDDYEKKFVGSKIDRDNFIRFVVRATGITDLFLTTESENESYIIRRPFWDGYWYQVYSSPFAKIYDKKDFLPIASLHEAVLCSVRVLHITLGLRSSGCCLVSGENCSQGTTWFLENLDSYAKKFEFIEDDVSIERLSLHQAYSLIGLAMGSKHYLSEEYRKQREKIDWEPQKITLFLCYYAEYMAWLIFLIRKIQTLRIANINRRFGIPWETLWPKESLGLELLDKTRFCRDKLSYNAKSEYGAAHRFWRLRQTAIPGLGWGILCLVYGALVWPIFESADGEIFLSIIFLLYYFIGTCALLEGVNFLIKLIWSPPFEPPKGLRY